MDKFSSKKFWFSGDYNDAKDLTRFHAAYMKSKLESFEHVLKIISDAGVIINPAVEEILGGVLDDYKKAIKILALRAAIDEGKVEFDSDGRIIN